MLNQATILGRVGKIETKTTSNGVKITNISMVTSRKFTKNGQKEEKVTWHNVTFFTKLAEISEQYVNVGDLLLIQGEMDNQKWTDQNGQERIKYFVLGNDLKLMPKSKEHQSTAPAKNAEPAFKDDDVPW